MLVQRRCKPILLRYSWMHWASWNILASRGNKGGDDGLLSNVDRAYDFVALPAFQPLDVRLPLEVIAAFNCLSRFWNVYRQAFV